MLKLDQPYLIIKLKQCGCEAIKRFEIKKHTFYKWLDKFKPDLAVIFQGNNLDGINWMQAV